MDNEEKKQLEELLDKLCNESKNCSDCNCKVNGNCGDVCAIDVIREKLREKGEITES